MEDRTLPSASLHLTLVAPPTALAGGQVTYGLMLTNNGPDNAQSVSLTDSLPTGTTFVSQAQNSGPAFTLGNSGSQVTDTIATLPAGTSASFTVVASIAPATPSNTCPTDGN